MYRSQYMLLYLLGRQPPHLQAPHSKWGLILMWFLIFSSRRQLAHTLDLRAISPPNFQPMKHSPIVFSLSKFPSSGLLRKATAVGVQSGLGNALVTNVLKIPMTRVLVSLISRVLLGLVVYLPYVMFTAGTPTKINRK